MSLEQGQVSAQPSAHDLVVAQHRSIILSSACEHFKMTPEDIRRGVRDGGKMRVLGVTIAYMLERDTAASVATIAQQIGCMTREAAELLTDASKSITRGDRAFLDTLADMTDVVGDAIPEEAMDWHRQLGTQPDPARKKRSARSDVLELTSRVANVTGQVPESVLSRAKVPEVVRTRYIAITVYYLTTMLEQLVVAERFNMSTATMRNAALAAIRALEETGPVRSSLRRELESALQIFGFSDRSLVVAQLRSWK